MQKIGFYIFLPILYFFSILPFRVVYLLSDLLFPLLYALGYRKKVVRKNLINSFPNKNLAEIIRIEKGFYRYIIDFLFEVLKCITMQPATFLERVQIEKSPIVEELFKKNKNIIITSGHYGNHEMANLALPSLIPFQVKAVYKPLSNKYFNDFFYRFRTRYGSQLIPMKEAAAELEKKDIKPFALVLLNDQSPPPEKAFWTSFLNQETGFFTGMARFSKQYDLPILYMSIQAKSRGKYCLKVQLLCENPQEMSEEEMIRKHANFLETDINSEPRFWFWSHKRWKFTKKDGKIIKLDYNK